MAIPSVNKALASSTAYPLDRDGNSDDLTTFDEPARLRIAKQNALTIGPEENIEQDDFTIGLLPDTGELPAPEDINSSRNLFAWQNNWREPPANLRPDGKIGNFSQGKIGDCFVLTALYATAQSSAGREKIKDSITKTSKGVYSIQFAGDPDHDEFTVTQAEVVEARANKQVSTGDPDVAIFDLAVRKYEAMHGQSSRGGNTGQVLQLLNGQPVVETKNHDTATARQLIHEAAIKPGGFVLTLGAGVNKSTGKPVNHDTDPLSSPNKHAFTVTSIDEKAGTATLANPWDTTKVYTISIDELASVGKLFSV